MDKKQNTYLIIISILALLTAIVFVFFSIALFKYEKAIKNPYYFCDGDWTCCNKDNPGCDADLIGKGLTTKDATPTTYKASDKYMPGSSYHQNCVLPVQNGILNYNQGSTTNFDFGYLYLGTSAPGGNPSPYYPGCSGPGSTYTGTKPECTNPKYNPWFSVDTGSGGCPYIGYDTPYNTEPQPVFDKTNPSSLNSGQGPASGAYTITPSTWSNGSYTAPYIANINGGNYTCPYITVKNKGNSTTGNTLNNTLGPTPT